MKTNYLICYDITRPRRWRKVFNLLKGSGIHLQYSVFYCSFTWQELLEIKGKLKTMINPKYDDIRIYPLPSDKKILALGRGDKVPEGADLFIK